MSSILVLKKNTPRVEWKCQVFRFGEKYLQGRMEMSSIPFWRKIPCGEIGVNKYISLALSPNMPF